MDQPERQLSFDASARTLTLDSAQSSRREVECLEILGEIETSIRALPEDSGMSGREVEKQFSESSYTRDNVRAALRYGVKSGRLWTERGPRHATLYHVSAPVRGSAPGDASRSTAPVRGPYIDTAHSRTDMLPDPVNGDPFHFDADPTGTTPVTRDQEFEL